MAVRIYRVDKKFNDFKYFEPYVNEDGTTKDVPIGDGYQIWDSVNDAPISPVFDNPDDIVKFGASFGLVEGWDESKWSEKVDFELNVRQYSGDKLKAFFEHCTKFGLDPHMPLNNNG